MEFLICVVALCIIVVLAMRYGHDSREPAESKEQTWANLGVHLDRTPAPSEAPPTAAATPLVHLESAAQRQPPATSQPVGTPSV